MSNYFAGTYGMSQTNDLRGRKVTDIEVKSDGNTVYEVILTFTGDIKLKFSTDGTTFDPKSASPSLKIQQL
jgi:hypothetical protein